MLRKSLAAAALAPCSPCRCAAWLRHVYAVEANDHGGLRYPHLARIPGTPDYLGRILSPLR